MKLTLMSSIALLITAVNAHAFEAIATVVGVVPINENVNIPTQNCWAEYPQQVQPAPQHNRDSNRINAAPAPVQRCQHVDHFETRTTGYQVTYEYDGQSFLTRLPYNPGTQLRVNVSVAPQ